MRAAGKLMPVLCVCVLLCGCMGKKNPEAEKAATQAARTWLRLVDEGQYDESWQESAAFFRNAVSQEAWRDSMKTYRQPLGEKRSRAHVPPADISECQAVAKHLQVGEGDLPAGEGGRDPREPRVGERRVPAEAVSLHEDLDTRREPLERGFARQRDGGQNCSGRAVGRLESGKLQVLGDMEVAMGLEEKLKLWEGES